MEKFELCGAFYSYLRWFSPAFTAPTELSWSLRFEKPLTNLNESRIKLLEDIID